MKQHFVCAVGYSNKTQLNIASDITSDITSDMRMEKISSHTQQKLHWGNDDLDIATVVKLQIMKINTILLTEPVFMALIASFISNHVVLLCSHVQHTFLSKGSRISKITTSC
jgi:hypothetical protein